MLDEIRGIKSGKKELREFGLTVGAILVILGVLALWRENGIYAWLLTPGLSLIGLGLFSPKLLLPFQKIWMAFSIVIGFFMSRLILAVLFYTVITPIGLAVRIFGRDILDERIDRLKKSYWIRRVSPHGDKAGYEKQY